MQSSFQIAVLPVRVRHGACWHLLKFSEDRMTKANTSAARVPRGPAMAALIGFGLLAGHQLAAAPFCVRTDAIPPQCIFFEAASCNTRAMQMGGTCVPNPAEWPVTVGSGHFCLLTSSRVASCIYVDAGTCAIDAHHQQGVCVPAANRPESPAPDPYRDIRPSMAGG